MDGFYQQTRHWLYLRELTNARLNQMQRKNNPTFVYSRQMTVREEVELATEKLMRNRNNG